MSLSVLGAEGIAVGSTRDAVLAELGEPAGSLQLEDIEFLLYERGRIELTDGRVTKASLISEEAAAELRLQKELAKQSAAKNAALEREKRLKVGGALRLAKLSDGDFLSMPAGERVAYWKWFRHTYPEVDVSDLITKALKEYEAELAVARAEADRVREIAALTARVEAAEDRAAQAENDARRRARNEYVSYPVYYPVVWQPQPACPKTIPKPPMCTDGGVKTTVRWGFSDIDRVGVFDFKYPATVSGRGYF